MKYAGLSVGQLDLSDRYFIVAVTVILISILMYIVSSKLDHEVVNAEQSQFDFRLAELRSAVRLQEAVLVAKDQTDQAYRYEGFNPMLWMEPETSHYLGEMSLESVSGQEGNWVYDPIKKVIAYKGRSHEFLSNNGNTESKWLQFKVVALWFSKEGFSKEDPSKEELIQENGIKAGGQIKQNLVAKGLRLKQLGKEY